MPFFLFFRLTFPVLPTIFTGCFSVMVCPSCLFRPWPGCAKLYSPNRNQRGYSRAVNHCPTHMSPGSNSLLGLDGTTADTTYFHEPDCSSLPHSRHLALGSSSPYIVAGDQITPLRSRFCKLSRDPEPRASASVCSLFSILLVGRRRPAPGHLGPPHDERQRAQAGDDHRHH